MHRLHGHFISHAQQPCQVSVPSFLGCRQGNGVTSAGNLVGHMELTPAAGLMSCFCDHNLSFLFLKFILKLEEMVFTNWIVVWLLLEPHFNRPLRFRPYCNSKHIQALTPRSYAMLGSSVLALLAVSEQALTTRVEVGGGKRRTLRQEWRAHVYPERSRDRGVPVEAASPNWDWDLRN